VGGIIKEFRCKKHGNFESSHEICPSLGCDSSKVERVFLTPVGIKSEFVSRHEKGIKKLAQAYGQSDFKTARAGEASIKHPVGQELLWGANVQKTLGMDINALVARTAQPFVVEKADGSREVVPHGMRLAADLGIQNSVVPPAGELTVSKHEPKMQHKLKGAA
jgi:hypothetical protein